MSDETTLNSAPASMPVPQTPETPISTPPEAVIIPTSFETPVAPIPTPEQIPEPVPAQMGGNEPFALSSRCKAKPPHPRHLGTRSPSGNLILKE